jgi:hypothetical protein
LSFSDIQLSLLSGNSATKLINIVIFLAGAKIYHVRGAEGLLHIGNSNCCGEGSEDGIVFEAVKVYRKRAIAIAKTYKLVSIDIS